MAARFFVDETDLALAKALTGVWAGVVFPGHEDLPEVPRQTTDDRWLEVVGTRGLVVITRDQKIRYRPVEKRMWVTHGVRGFVLTGPPEPVDGGQPGDPAEAPAGDRPNDGRPTRWTVDVRRDARRAPPDPALTVALTVHGVSTNEPK